MRSVAWTAWWALALGCRPASPSGGWALWAVEYARSEGVPVDRLVEGAADEASVDMSWLFYVAVGPERVVLVDAGHDFAEEDPRVEAWSVREHRPVAEALGRLGLDPADVTDVVLTHHHWDHVDGLPTFRGATVHAVWEEWEVLRSREAGLVGAIEEEGRLSGHGRGPAEVAPGIVLDERGHHTEHSAIVEVDCGFPAVVLMDAAYLYRNVEEGLPIASTPDPEGNVADVRALAERAEREGGVVLPGHDPEVFERHPGGIAGLAAVCP